MAIPTGTRKSINANRTTKPMTATASVLMRLASLDGLHGQRLAHELFRMKYEAIGSDRNQKHRRGVAEPGDGEEWPRRQAHIEGAHVVSVGADYLVKKRIGLHGHHEQQNQRREDVGPALVTRANVAPNQIHRDVRAAVRGSGNAPEDENAEEKPAKIVRIGNLEKDAIAEQ